MASAMETRGACWFDDLDEIELPEIDSSVVMSLLEDSVQSEDDEMLRRVIQSLEAEMMMMNKDSGSWEGDCEFCDVEGSESGSSSPPDDRMYLEGLEEEMMAFDVGDFGEEMESVVGFVNYGEICDFEMVMEEDGYHGLWQ